MRRLLRPHTLFPYTTLFRSRAGRAEIPCPQGGLRRGPAEAVLRLTGRYGPADQGTGQLSDRKSTRLNSSHRTTSYAVFCLKNKEYQQCRDAPHTVAHGRSVI